MAERAPAQPRTIGVILRDVAGTFYVFSAERLAAFEVADDRRPLVEALIRGEDVIGLGGRGDGVDDLAALCRSLQGADGRWARSLHPTHVAASLWLIGR